MCSKSLLFARVSPFLDRTYRVFDCVNNEGMLRYELKISSLPLGGERLPLSLIFSSAPGGGDGDLAHGWRFNLSDSYLSKSGRYEYTWRSLYGNEFVLAKPGGDSGNESEDYRNDANDLVLREDGRHAMLSDTAGSWRMKYREGKLVLVEDLSRGEWIKIVHRGGRLSTIYASDGKRLVDFRYDQDGFGLKFAGGRESSFVCSSEEGSRLLKEFHRNGKLAYGFSYEVGGESHSFRAKDAGPLRFEKLL